MKALELAGCPQRRITGMVMSPRRGGAMLKLECGHEQWVAGFTQQDAQAVMLRRSTRPCLSGCYRHQRFMGR